MRLRTVVYLGNLALKFETLAADSRERSEARLREYEARREEERRKAERAERERREPSAAENIAAVVAPLIQMVNERQERMPPMHDGLLDAGDGTWIPAPYGVKRGADGKWSPLSAPKTRR